MKARVGSTVILCVLVAWVLWSAGILGGVFLLALCSALTQWELYQLMEKMGWKPQKKMATAWGIIVVQGSFFSREGIFDFSYVLSALVLATVIFAFFVVLAGEPEDLKNIFLPTIFGILYVPTLFCIPLLFARNLLILSDPNLPLLLILWIIFVAKLSDIGGLLVGRRFGKRKLAPAFSPQKTYEGLMGSLLFSVTGGYIFVFCCGCAWPANFTGIKIGAIAAIIAVIALISDLVESGFKRLAGVKDSGRMIPGIGGAFDLMDSLILSLPAGVIIIKTFIFR
ncbi:MAG: phosphatidate cytidylyltransferase [Puniceicoccales bacterium]|jgi:phosphatidate cytidylyltransferase|nr:phosphatidate cytidylyltransferase [Puniceicoccales bacterium]